MCMKMNQIPQKNFCKLNNLICTPHIAGNSIESVIGMGLASINHLVKYFKKMKKYKVAITGYGIVGKDGITLLKNILFLKQLLFVMSGF